MKTIRTVVAAALVLAVASTSYAFSVKVRYDNGYGKVKEIRCDRAGQYENTSDVVCARDLKSGLEAIMVIPGEKVIAIDPID